MPAVDIAPLMDSPVWKDWPESKRAEAKRLWQDRDTSDDDRALMLQQMQGRRRNHAAHPSRRLLRWCAGETDRQTQPTPSPWQALKGAFAGLNACPSRQGRQPDRHRPGTLTGKRH